MKILLLNAYFYPEVISFTHLEQDLIEGFLEAGHEISVICPIPTRGVAAELVVKYKSIKQESVLGVHVRRFWAPQEGKNYILRAFRYIWCNLCEYYIGTKYKDIDLLFAVSTPPTQGFLAGKLAKKLKCPLVYSLQDVFPDSLVTTGKSREGSISWKIGRKIEDKTYSLCSKIIVISNTIKKNLMNKGVSIEKLEMIPNWVDTDDIKPVERDSNKLIAEYNLDKNKFIVVYAGNFGAAQDIDVIISAAELLKCEQAIQFVIFGSGSEYKAIKRRVEKINNIIMNPLLPLDRVSEVYSLGDVALITCKKGVGKSGMPSKTWSIMACNTSIIASFDMDSELAEIIKATDAGICVEPGNAEKLAGAIKESYLILNSGVSCRVCNSRKYVLQTVSKKVCVEEYSRVISFDHIINGMR